MSDGALTQWSLKGTAFIACNCDFGCPCNFNARPTYGHCEGGWTWHVEEGSYNDTKLDGLNFSVYVNWPGAIHEGNGEALILIDERADASQRAAIETLIGGKIGGPWGILAWTWPKIHGPYATAYEVTFDGINTRVKAGDYVAVECGPIRNPVTGAESHPGIVLPAPRLTFACRTASSTITRESTWARVRSITHGREDPEHNNHDATHTRQAHAGRTELLYQNECGEHCNPREIHHAHCEQHAHQSPAASKTVKAMPDAQL